MPNISNTISFISIKVEMVGKMDMAWLISTSLFIGIDDSRSAAFRINKDLEKINRMASNWHVTLLPDGISSYGIS